MSNALLLEPAARIPMSSRTPRSHRPSAPTPGAREVVFVVDADESRRRSSERMLQRAGYNVRSFASPEALMKAVSQRRSSPPRSRPAGVDPEAERSLDQLEREAIEAALRRTHGNITRAMKQLGIGRTTLYRKLKRYGLR